MSSLARWRSLRKPSATDTTSAKQPDRHGSPSRLPVKPPTRTPSTTTTTSNLKPTRPISGALGRTASTRQPSDPTKRDPGTRYPPSTTTTRPTPTTRPTSSGNDQPTRRAAPTHTRAKSTTTVKPSTVLRPPSQGSRPTHTRQLSVDRTPQQQQPPPPPPPPPSRTQPPGSKARPAFSTLQQHYTPAKTRDPKPLTSTIVAPPSPSKLPANVAAGAEISRLQAELLQMHLLHKDAAIVQDQWRSSAKEKLGKRFARLVASENAVAQRERASVEEANVAALRDWGGELEGKIQALDTVVTGLWNLSEPGGRYARIVRRFERWVGQVRDVEDARGGEGFVDDPGQGLFVSELETPWKEDLQGILRKLETWRGLLGDMGEVPRTEGGGKSSVQRMLAGSWSLVLAMRTELEVMEEMEREALAREEAWMEAVMREEEHGSGAGAIWRRVV